MNNKVLRNNLLGLLGYSILGHLALHGSSHSTRKGRNSKAIMSQ
jgi:hypothetical protein